MKEALSVLFAGFIAAVIFFGGIILFVELTKDEPTKPTINAQNTVPTQAHKPTQSRAQTTTKDAYTQQAQSVSQESVEQQVAPQTSLQDEPIAQQEPHQGHIIAAFEKSGFATGYTSFNVDQRDNTYKVIIEVINNTNMNAKFDAIFNVFDSNGSLIDYEPYGECLPSTVAPGGHAWVQVSMGTLDTAWSGTLTVVPDIKLKESWFVETELPVSDVKIGDGILPDMFGRVYNNTSTTTESVSVYALFRDDAGNPIGIWQTYTDDIDAGEYASFSMPVWFSQPFASCDVWAARMDLSD